MLLQASSVQITLKSLEGRWTPSSDFPQESIQSPEKEGWPLQAASCTIQIPVFLWGRPTPLGGLLPKLPNSPWGADRPCWAGSHTSLPFPCSLLAPAMSYPSLIYRCLSCSIHLIIALFWPWVSASPGDPPITHKHSPPSSAVAGCTRFPAGKSSGVLSSVILQTLPSALPPELEIPLWDCRPPIQRKQWLWKCCTEPHLTPTSFAPSEVGDICGSSSSLSLSPEYLSPQAESL